MINWFKQLLGVPEQKKSSLIAKERLMVIVAHERGAHETQPDFLPLLQKELTDVIAKYVRIDKDQVQVEFEQKGGRSVLELNITLPDGELKKARAQNPSSTEQSATHTPAMKLNVATKPQVRSNTKPAGSKPKKPNAAGNGAKRRGRPSKPKE